MADACESEAPCTVAELEDIITHPAGGFYMMPSNAFDEVYDNLFIGEESIAKNIVSLGRRRFTHILNAAHGKECYHVDTDSEMYKKIHVTFMGVTATDHMNFDLYPFFQQSADFIDSALESGGKILVHCIEGVSRSTTLTVAFLMLKRHLPVKDALRLVRSGRQVCPNPGFLEQLIKLDNELKLKGHYKKLD